MRTSDTSQNARNKAASPCPHALLSFRVAACVTINADFKNAKRCIIGFIDDPDVYPDFQQTEITNPNAAGSI
jgi:hypothetical protein